jgi:tRNA threonylcarbamoyladenosine biosynthesis protein TsaE
LIREICAAFQVEDNVSSPTFSLVNEYQNSSGETFYHFDFYRIKTEAEAMDMGCDEYFYSGNTCFIEWPSQISNLIPETNLTIHIFENTDQSRSIALYKNG